MADTASFKTISGSNTVSANLTGLSSGVAYYWRVRSFDGTVYSYSPIVSFTKKTQ